MGLIKKSIIIFFAIGALFACKSKYINDRLKDSINAEDNSGTICVEEIGNYVFYKKCERNFFQCGIRKTDVNIESVLPFELYRFTSKGALDTLIPVIEKFYDKINEGEISSISNSTLEYHFKIRYKNNSHSLSYNRDTNKWGELKEGWQ